LPGSPASGRKKINFSAVFACQVVALQEVHDDIWLVSLAVVAAGIARGGTVAAGEFVVDGHRLEELANRASKDWPRKNIEIVLETQVIDDRSGPPRIVAVYAW
jgi:hypothetical protein